MTTALRSALGTPRVGARRPTGAGLAIPMPILLAWSGLMPLWLVAHWTVALVPVVPLGVAALIPRWRDQAWPWFLSFALWVPLMPMGWAVLEDHVYAVVYWVFAVGLALTTDDVRSSLRFQARLLVGLAFGVSVLWKVTSVAYLSGDMFRTVLIRDSRFDVLTRSLGGVDQEQIDAARQTLVGYGDPGAGIETVPLGMPAQFGWFVGLLVVWTLVVETMITLSFIARDTAWLAKLRHPALLAFCLSTYPFVPVVGFALLFSVLGLTLTSRLLWQWGYVAVITLALVAVF